MARLADTIRIHGRERYVTSAQDRRLRRFSIRIGDVVRELKLNDRVRAVCTALKSKAFLENNGLKLVEKSGPPSGQSTTVVYTYEFLEAPEPNKAVPDPFYALRGILKGVFAELGGGEAYLRGERENFYGDKEKP